MGSKAVWSENKIARLIAEGHGSGSGAGYRPWLTATMFSSLGRTRQVWSPKTGRVHHFFSDVEYRLFLALEWASDVVDIREQFPLERDITLEVARTLKLRHPYYPGTDVATVMTVDFLVTRVRGGEKVLEAFDAKRTDEAEDERSLSKLEISRESLAISDIGHHLVFHSSIPVRAVENIEWVRDALPRPDEEVPSADYWPALQRRMLERWPVAKKTSSLLQFCNHFDVMHGCEPGTGLRVARMLINKRNIAAPMAGGPLADALLSEFNLTGALGALRIVGGA
jgi:hypothetical protein